MVVLLSCLALIAIVVLVWLVLKSRNMHLWIISYARQQLTRPSKSFPDKHIYVCLADHHEPYLGNVDKEKAHSRVKRWLSNYPAVALKHTDSDGRHPQHSYFYPEEEYDEWVMEQIRTLCDAGLGDVDIHLHHDNDTAENLTQTLNNFKKLLHERHGFLRKNEAGEIVYGFIHGNWALDNSRPDGKWCGVDNEIEVLLNTGCVYDMTMPSAPSDTQTSTINSIYLAKEKGHCKSHNEGSTLKVGDSIHSDELLMIQGPLALDWNNRKLGLVPRIDAGEISYDAPPKERRLKLWEDCSVSVQGADEHIFIKLHTHGLDDDNSTMFFDKQGFETLWTALENRYKNQPGCSLHYVTAWEMYEKITALAEG